jgi:hypothetical protein
VFSLTRLDTDIRTALVGPRTKPGGSVADAEPILDETPDNLQESVQRIRATQNRLWASGLVDHPNYGELSYRLSAALAMTEAAFLEARRRSELGKGH